MNDTCKIIACRNIKGGSGNTVHTLNMGFALSENGTNVVCMQLSKYPDFEHYIHLSNSSTIADCHRYMKENESVSEISNACFSTYQSLKIIPSTRDTSFWKKSDYTDHIQFIQLLASKHDVVLIDIDSSAPQKIINQLLKICDQHIIFSNFDHAAVGKTKAYLDCCNRELLSKSGVIINQMPSGIQWSEKIRMGLRSESLGTLPYAPDDIFYIHSYRAPIMKKKKNSLGAHYKKILENLFPISINSNEQ